VNEQHSETREPARPESEQAEDEEVDTSHLDGLEDGCGCAEVMDHLSERREE
jgi:hypothetical protein